MRAAAASTAGYGVIVADECDHVPAQGGTDGTSTTRLSRSAAHTKAAIEDAFVQLVLEQGYERVAVRPGMNCLLKTWMTVGSCDSTDLALS